MVVVENHTTTCSRPPKEHAAGGDTRARNQCSHIKRAPRPRPKTLLAGGNAGIYDAETSFVHASGQLRTVRGQRNRHYPPIVLNREEFGLACDTA